MLAFSRLTSILLFVLSLSFLTCALPSPAAPGTQALAAPGAGEKCHALVVDLRTKVDAHCAALVDLKVVTEVAARANLLAADVKACADAIVKLGAKVSVDAEVKAKICVEVAAIITVMVKVCVALVAKFGILVLVTILAKIDLCLKLLLVNLNICFEGIITLILELVVKIDIKVLIDAHLPVCLTLLGIKL